MDFTGSLIGRQLANFRIERLLGHGGMAKVYYGVDIRLRRPVAVKVIDDRYRDEELYAERFLREARAMASWQHPNIPRIYQAGEEQGLYYYAMEYIQGLDLERLLRQYQKTDSLPPHSDVIQIGRAVADALDYAHQKGAVHRDVKPSNVLISQDGRILLSDFGLVMQVAQGTLGEAFGTPYYISPEQVRSSAWAVPQSDVYALGVMLYRMLTGVLPFDDPSPIVVAHQHLYVDPPSPLEKNPDLSSSVEGVLLKAMSKAPEQRYATGRELIDALQGALLGNAADVIQISPVGFPPVTVPFLAEDIGQGEEINFQTSTDQKRTRRILTLPVLQAIQYSIPNPSQIPTFADSPSGGLVGWINSRRTGFAVIGLVIVLALTSFGALAVWRNNQENIPVSGIQPEEGTRLFLSTIQTFGQSFQGVQPTQTAQPNPTLTPTERESGAGSMASSPTSTRSNTTVAPSNTPQPAVIIPTQTLTIEPQPPADTQEPAPVIPPPPTQTSRPPTPTNTIQPAPTFTNPPPTPLPPTPIVPTEDPGSVSGLALSLRKNQDDSLFVINQGISNLSLGPLVIGNGEGQVSGGEWGVAELEPGQCVAIRKAGGSSESPPGNCSVVGAVLERSGSGVFWESDYSVFYAGAVIGSCGLNGGTCNIKL